MDRTTKTNPTETHEEKPTATTVKPLKIIWRSKSRIIRRKSIKTPSLSQTQLEWKQLR